jgi:hypothetical protein
MGRLSAVECFNAKPGRKGRDRMLGDGDGLFLRIRAHGTRTWVIEYLFEGARRKFTIGILDRLGAAGESISSWLDNGRLTLAQARDRRPVEGGSASGTRSDRRVGGTPRSKARR